MITQEVLNDAYLLLISGVAKMKNNKEIEWRDEGYGNITIEFPTLNAFHAIVRGYRQSGNIYWQTEISPTYGKSLVYYENEDILLQEEWKDGVRIKYDATKHKQNQTH